MVLTPDERDALASVLESEQRHWTLTAAQGGVAADVAWQRHWAALAGSLLSEVARCRLSLDDAEALPLLRSAWMTLIGHIYTEADDGKFDVSLALRDASLVAGVLARAEATDNEGTSN